MFLLDVLLAAQTPLVSTTTGPLMAAIARWPMMNR
jgi:hypothetical protein